ncbi:MAG: hypothetical protein BWY30_00198 [Tenericutes bacterium ADurb.Bin239]|nr:MAG: hypothetical protein BWY30_00198 [Tenericutes bacterium ADurb.Bin239]
MKKTFTLMTLALGATLALSGCTKPQAEVTAVIKSQTMAFEATTALTLVGGFETTPEMQTLKRALAASGVAEPDIPVATLDILFNNGVDFHIEHGDSDLEGYAYVDTISFNIGDDSRIEYALYYNLETSADVFDDDDDEVVPSEEISVAARHGTKDEDDDTVCNNGTNCNGDDDDDNNGDRDRDRDRNRNRDREKDKHYRIRGIAIVGDEEYRFMSKTTSEVDDDETETKLRFMLWKDDDNFINIKQEIEIEGTPGTPDYEYEEEFHYMVVKDGEVAKNFKLELENEDNKLELEVKIDGVKYEVEYETVGDRTFIKIKVQGNEYIYEKVVTTNEETGEVSVSYVLQ